MTSSDRVIVALDVPSRGEALDVVRMLGVGLTYVKVGMQLFYTAGPPLVRELKNMGLKVFLDVKIHDIPNTAFGAIRSLGALGCDMINVHCSGGLEMMMRAREAAGNQTKLVGVTVLTSTDQAMLRQQLGVAGTLPESVARLARLAKRAGLDGVVCSPQEVDLVKRTCGSSFLTVTPGVRPTGEGLQDQKRVMTPGEAVQAGSDYLVIGRPILAHADPAEALQAILREIGAC